MVELNGRLFVNAYLDTSGNPKASLNCHANSIKIHSTVNKELETIGTSEQPTHEDDKKDDLPF